MRIFLRLAFVAAVANLAGCATTNAIHYTVELDEPLSEAACAAPAPTETPEQIVGLALSGGGSRASVFSAAVMEALWEHGYTDLVTHVSGVSGGSFAAGYYAANLPECGALQTTEEQDACWRDFYSEFKLAMRSQFFRAMVSRQASKFRLASNTRMAFSLQETLDDQFLGGMTFGDLAAKNASMVDNGVYPPVLLVNATSYDNGRRVVFSNRCLSDNPPATASDIGPSPLDDPALRGTGLAPPNCNQAAPQDMPVSLAVTTSAAFPGIVGPMTIEVPATCDGEGLEYWHLADGGMVDNSGLDSIQEVVLRQLRAEPRVLERALIFSVTNTPTEDESELRQIRNYWPSQHLGQALLPYTGRSDGYRRLFWTIFEDGAASNGFVIENIDFFIMSAELDRWPESCPQAERATEQDPETVRAEITEALAAIPTHYKISECNADLAELAARDVVDRTLDADTVERLAEMGFVPRRSRSAD